MTPYLLPPLLALIAGCASSPDTRTEQALSAVAIEGRAAATRTVSPAASALAKSGPVSVSTERIKANEQLFNTTVQTDTDTVKSTFATSSNALAPAVTRLESSWTREISDGEAKLRLGDAVSVPGANGNPVRFAGVQLGSGLDLGNNVVSSTRLATPGIATLPSSVDALLSNANAADNPLARRGLALQGNVQVTGANSVSFVTRDALGRTIKVNQPLLTGIRLAESGCSNYAVDLGRVRRDYALESNAYGQWFANTRVLCGMPLGFTLEGHGEYLDQQGGAVGIGVARRLSSLGIASVGVSSSQAASDSGWLARASFEHSNSAFDLNVQTSLQSPDFRRVGMSPATDPTLRSTVASLGMKVGTASDLAVVYATETTQADITAALVALTQRMRVGAFNSITMTAGQSLAATTQALSVYLSFTRAFGMSRRRTSALPNSIDLIRTPRLLLE